jgi:hypothetical protein
LHATPRASGEVRQSPQRIAVIGNDLSRQCGIATLTSDFCEALLGRRSDSNILALPLNDADEGYDDPGRVSFGLAQNSLSSFVCAEHRRRLSIPSRPA